VLLVVSRYALLSYGDRRVWVKRPRLLWSLCQVIVETYALRLNSRAGTEGSTSTVSSLICDHWLILGSETRFLSEITFSSSHMRVMNHIWSTASSSTECSRDKPPFSFVRGQDSTMSDIVWVSPQGHRSVSVSHHFLLQAPQCPCSMRKWFSRDHCCRGRSKPGCRIVGSHTRWKLTTWADWVESLSLHYLCFFCNFR